MSDSKPDEAGRTDDHLTQVTSAVSDPVRRGIIESLSRGPMPVNDLVECFEVSRPAVSRHLRLLREAGLVRDEPVGRQRIYVLDPEPLALIGAWLGSVRAPATASEWDRRFDALTTEVHRTRRERERRVADETRETPVQRATS